jgi:PAS domain S-box-containing protein
MVEERTRELNRALYDTEQARDRMDGILKSVADGLIVTDVYNRIILMNRAAEDLLDVRFSEVKDRPIDFAIENKTLRERIKTTLDKKESGYRFDFELPGEEKEHSRIIRAMTSVIEDKSGNQTGIVSVIHDVTYEREVDRMKTEFITTAAHELRTPLTSIQGFSEILLTRDDIEGEEKKECLSYINKQSVNLAAIINDLLDISRIESGKGFSLNKAPADIAGIIKDTVPHFRTLSPKHEFDIILPEEPVEMMLDKEKMGQVLENLLSNAIKYSPEGGTIYVTAKRIGEFGVRNEGLKEEEKYSTIEIRVTDQGIGMSSEQIEKIFDKFYRVDASNTAIPGTGLGMNIVKHLVEAHGGKVWVEGELGKGTTVRFTITG